MNYRQHPMLRDTDINACVYEPPSNCSANIATYAENFLLSYLLQGSTATRPVAWGVGLSLGSPTSVSGSEITTASGYARATANFSSAAINTFINTVAATYGPFSGAASVSGISVWDTVLSLNSGDLLLFGLLATARTIGIGDSLVLASGALSISLS